MNIWSTAGFYNNPSWIGYNPVTCALNAYGQWKYVDNTIYIDRTDTDNFPWSANGVPGYYGVIGVINHEFGHAMADLDHQGFGGCAITNPIMVSSFDGRWSQCGQWGIANDDKWGVDNAY